MGQKTSEPRIAQIPADRLQDQRCLEVAALEVVLGPALQLFGNRKLFGNRTQDYEVPPNRRPNQELASASCLTRTSSGRRGCAAGSNPAFGCRSGARSRISRAASRRRRCCSAPAKRAELQKRAFRQEGGRCQCQNIGGKGPSERCPASQRPAARSLPRV